MLVERVKLQREFTVRLLFEDVSCNAAEGRWLAFIVLP
jgi:hypothetical protein